MKDSMLPGQSPQRRSQRQLSLTNQTLIKVQMSIRNPWKTATRLRFRLQQKQKQLLRGKAKLHSRPERPQAQSQIC